MYCDVDPSFKFKVAEVYGDGNCLPRTLSVALFQTEEMRVRLVAEVTQNMSRYLDNSELAEAYRPVQKLNYIRSASKIICA